MEEIIMNEMYHHGVKGQKWGVRRTPKQLGYTEGGSDPRQAKKEFKQDVKAYRKLKRGVTRGITRDRNINKRADLSDRGTSNTLRANMKLNSFIGKIKRSKGEEYVNQVKERSKKIDVRNKVTMNVTAAAVTTAAIVGANAVKTILMKKLGGQSVSNLPSLEPLTIWMN